MKLEKLLARGIAGWLQFEHSCQRAPIFSEKYLSTPIAQILNTEFGDRVHSEVKHPILGEKTPGRGRPPEIDFAILNEEGKIEVAIETKWVSDTVTKQTVERIVWDLVRLAMIGNNETVRCYFILAGKKSHLDRLFNNKHFNGELDKKGRRRPFLKVRKDDYMDVRIDSAQESRTKLLKPIFRLCQDVDLPKRLGTGVTHCYPTNAFKYDYQVLAWEVLPHRQKIVFKPKNHKKYRI